MKPHIRISLDILAPRFLHSIEMNRASEPYYSICQATQMKGKTVERVEVGSRNEIDNVHQSKVLKIHFTDGSILGIDADSNVGNLAREVPGFKGEMFTSVLNCIGCQKNNLA